MSGGKKVWKLAAKILGALFAFVLLVLTAVSLILAKPQPAQKEQSSVRQPIAASPAIEIQSEQDLVRLISAFPAPVMSFMSGSGMTFVSAVSSDITVAGGFGRIATLYWQTADGIPLILQSIYPSDALSLLESGYHFSAVLGPTLFSSQSVRMEKGDSIRIHTTTDQALYVLILPRSLSSGIPSLCRSLQLFTVHSDE